MKINVGSIWKKTGDWGAEKGQLVIVESVGRKIRYRYAKVAVHGVGNRDIIDFKERFTLIKDV